jgi:hypothetical protein
MLYLYTCTYHGTIILWYHDTMVPIGTRVRTNGTMVHVYQWYSSTMVLEYVHVYHGTINMVLEYSSTMVLEYAIARYCFLLRCQSLTSRR